MTTIIGSLFQISLKEKMLIHLVVHANYHVGADLATAQGMSDDDGRACGIVLETVLINKLFDLI